jgi:hypothetical protein
VGIIAKFISILVGPFENITRGLGVLNLTAEISDSSITFEESGPISLPH